MFYMFIIDESSHIFSDEESFIVFIIKFSQNFLLINKAHNYDGLKRQTCQLWNWFVTIYIDNLRTFGHRSQLPTFKTFRRRGKIIRFYKLCVAFIHLD